MTPRNELVIDRRLGPAGAELLYRTVRVIAVGRNFPPPDGSSSWDETAIVDVAHDFVDGERGRKRLLDITLRSVDDASFERLLDAAVHNFLRDIARRSDTGRLVRRVKEILRDEADFDALPGSGDRWSLAGTSNAAATTDPTTLASAIVGVQVDVPRWTSDRRDPPLADRPSFVRLIRAVLATAGGALPAADIAHVLATRLDHRRTALATPLDEMERLSEPADDDPADRTAAVLHARDIFNSLSDRERIILPMIEGSVRDLALMIGTGKSQAAHVRQRLVDRLRRELCGDDAALTVRALCELCDDWVRQRTGQQRCDVR